MKIFFEFIKRYYKNIIPYVVFSCLSQLLTLYIVNITGNASNLIISGNIEKLKATGAMLIFVVLLSIIAIPLFRLIQMKNFIKLGFSFDEWFYSKFINGEKSILDKYEKGILLNRLFMDPILYRADIIQIIGTGVIFVVVFSVSFFIMARISLKFALICVVLSITPMTLNYYIANKLRIIDIENRKMNNEIASTEKRVVDNFFFIKAQALENSTIQTFKLYYKKYLNFLKKRLVLEEGLKSFNEAYGIICNIAIYIIGSIFIAKGTINIGEAIKFIGVSIILKNNTINLNATIKSIMSLKNSSERVEDLIKEEKNGTLKVDEIKNINIKDLKFSYGDKLVFENVNLDINKGEKIIIKGKNGTGKSTLCKVILGIYKNYEGTITINGKDLYNIDLYNLRSKIHIAEQFPFIMNVSIFNNIKYCAHKNWISKIDEILVMLGIYEIKDKIAGNKGQFISGGEMQKISIARAIVSGADFIILDEPNTALDKTSRENIKEYFEKLNRTIIIISHENVWDDNWKCYSL